MLTPPSISPNSIRTLCVHPPQPFSLPLNLYPFYHSSLPPSLLTLGPHYSSKKPITPFSPSCTFSLYCIMRPFSAIHPLSNPFNGPPHLFLPPPFLLFFLTPEHTTSLLCLCLASSLGHSSLFFLPTASSHFPSTLSFHPFHPDMLSPHPSSFCPTKISSLCPQATSTHTTL